MSAVSFAVSEADFTLIQQITDRAQAMARATNIRPFDRQGAAMDITAVHANGCPLRLAELLAAEDFNFSHDVFGIFRHIDRETGHLRDCFVPRSAAR